MIPSNLPQEWVDYIFMEPEKKDPTIPVKILTGDYQGVILCFGTVKLYEDESGDFARLSFTYKILNQPRNRTKHLMKDATFKNYIGSILNSTILGDDDADGEGNLKVFDQEPEFRTKSTTISQD